MVWCRADLTRIKAALDRDPFADPVRAGPFTLSRKKARRLERELIAKFSASVALTVAPAGSDQPRPGHTSPLGALPSNLPGPQPSNLCGPGLSIDLAHEASDV